MGRGTLTQEIKDKSKEIFGYEFTQTELRLLPYIQYTMMNGQKIEPEKINGEERTILRKWKDLEWIEGGATGLVITKEFWNNMNELLWYSYVDYECE